MKIGSYETCNQNIIKLSKILDVLYDTCVDMHYELDSYNYDELCCIQMLLWDIYGNTIQRFRSNDWKINLKSSVELWKLEDDILDIKKKKLK